jgi:elongation factor 1-gamma
LYTYGGNFRALKVFIASAYSGVKVDVDSKFVFGDTNKSEAFRKKFPVGKVIIFYIIMVKVEGMCHQIFFVIID